MKDCAIFQLGSRTRSVCEGFGGLTLEEVNQFRKKVGIIGLPALPQEVVGQDIASVSVIGIPPQTTNTGNTKAPAIVHTILPIAGQIVNSACCSGKGKVQVLAPISGPGTELILMLKGVGFAGCDACYALAKQMDRWGKDCSQHLDEIIEDMLPRMIAWEQANIGWVSKLIPQGANRATLKILINKAIEKSKNI